MKKETLKNCMVRDKAFLRDLYANNNPLKNRRVINGANDNQLNTLIAYLHYLVTGEIKINKTNFESIKGKISFLRKNVQKRATFLALLNGDRIRKVNFLFKLSNILSNLLYGVFNLP